jgi:Fe-S-cluster-containing dehydrogenase component
VERWHLIIDVEKCEDCNNCFLACKDEHVGNDWLSYSAAQPRHGQRWIDIVRKERGSHPLVDVAYKPVTCVHCDEAPCVAAGPGAVRKRDDGIVLIDPEAARGRSEIVDSCPYGVIYWNEELELAQKCTLCAHLLDAGWQETRCTQACPTGALKLEKLTDERMAARAVGEKLEVLRPELGTSPTVYYRNLHRFDACFIAGSVSFDRDGVVDCAKGARVELSAVGEEAGASARLATAEASGDAPRTATTDAFGDFKFDCLEPGSGAYRLRVYLPGFEDLEVQVELAAESVALPDLKLTER